MHPVEMLGTMRLVRRQAAAVSAETRGRDADRVAREVERARSAVAHAEGASSALPALALSQPTPGAPAAPPPPPGVTELPGGVQIQRGPGGVTISTPGGERIEKLSDGRTRISTPDGRVITTGPGGGILSNEGPARPFDAATSPSPQNDIPPEVVPLVGTIFGLTALTIIGFPIARAFARRMDRKQVAPAASADVSGRLERIEQAIEAIAVEVERVSEGQRYSARLLTDRLPDAATAREIAAERAR